MTIQVQYLNEDFAIKIMASFRNLANPSRIRSGDTITFTVTKADYAIELLVDVVNVIDEEISS
jgi:hypothetical protein